MKTLDDLVKFLDKKAKDIDKKVAEAQEKTAQQIWEDVIENAPVGNGDYISSIQIDETQINDGVISTFIGSDLQVGPTIWGSVQGSKNNPQGSTYNLGYLLEHGTFEHAIPNAFGYGFYYGFTDKSGKFHKGTLDDNWHPGSTARPHYSLAIEKNKKLFKDNIKLAWREK